MNKIKIYINDKEFMVEKNSLLIDVCRDNNFYIPSLCHMNGDIPFAGCRLCLVEIRDGKWYKLVASCEYPIRKSQKFYTDSPRVINSRKISAELLLARVPEAKDLLEDIVKQPLKGIFPKIDSSNDLCLLCGLCYRACQEFGPAAISACGRGTLKVIDTPYNEENPDCVSCGICASICPTQAIKTTEDENSISIWHQRSKRIICPQCGKKHITEKTFKFLTEVLNLPENEMLLCETCRKKSLSQSMCNSFIK